MSVLYNQFCIVDVLPDLKTKTIVITTNFKVDASTVNMKTVSLYDYKNEGSQIADYSLYVDGKSICIILNDYPPTDTKFFLKVNDIYDALNRKINYSYSNYIVFTNDVITDIEILSPAYRETFNKNTINIKLKITDPLEEGTYKVQISSDNTFFKILSTVNYNATSQELISSDDVVVITEDKSNSGEINFLATIDFNGQLYIRARAERSDSEVSRWCELIPFTINTVPVDSMDTTFLDQSLTTYDLFEDEFDLSPLNVNDIGKVVPIEDGMFYIEFNKAIALPEDYELTEDGYVDLGVVIGFRKGLE